MSLEVTKDLAIIAGTIVALTTFFTGVVEYARQSNLKRVEHFVQMRRRFLETPMFQDILRLITTDDPALKDLPVQDRRNFGGFLEEVALMMNSRLITRKVAHYMFGHYVVLTANSENFWIGLDREGDYWQLLRWFAQEMREEHLHEIQPARLRL